MWPFDTYPERTPGNERCLAGSGSSCRTGYGAKFQRVTGQTKCAYCGTPLTDTYEHWLLTSVDHVIPQYVVRKYGEGWRKWVDNVYNMVLCCMHCNTFLNGFRLEEGVAPPAWPEEYEAFCGIRDAEFERRRQWVKGRHCREECEYAKRPWEGKGEG